MSFWPKCGRHIAFVALLGVAFAPRVQARSVSLAELTQLLARKHPDLIAGKAEIERAQSQLRGVDRLNTPTFSVGVSRYTGELKDTLIPADTDRTLDQIDTELKGRIHRWGLGYSLSYSHYSQDQKPFDTFPDVKQDGRQVTLGLELNLLKDSGLRIGGLPYLTASQRVRLASLNQRANYQQLTWELLDHYLTTMLLQQQISNAKDTIGEAEKLKSQYFSLFHEGRISKVDYLSAEVQVKSAHAQVSRLKTLYRESIRTLLAFVGGLEKVEDESDVDLAPLSMKYIPASAVETFRKMENAPGSNSALQALEAQRNVLEAESRELKNELVPSLKLVAGQSWRKNAPSETLLSDSDLTYNQSFVGVKLEMPLDYSGPKSDFAAKRIEASSVGVKQQLLKENIVSKVRNLFTELGSLEVRLQLSAELEKLANERYQAALPLVERSTVARLDIFDYQNQMRELRAEMAEIQANVLRKRAEILYLNGALK